MALGPLIPEGAVGIADLAAVLVGLLALLAFCVCWGALYGWKHTFGALIDAITGLLRVRVFGLHVNFGWPLDKLNNAVQVALSKGVTDSELLMGKAFHAAGVLLGWMVNYMLATATVMEHAISWLVHVYIPGRASWAASLLYPPALIAKIIRSLIAKELPHIGRVVITKVYQPVIARTVKVVHAVTHPGTIALPGLEKDLSWLRRREANLAKRMHRVEGLFAAGVLATVLAQVFGVATRCLRKGNVGKSVRSVCGFDASLVESLLADGLAIASVLSVVEFASELRDIEDEALKILGGLVREWPS